MNDKAIKILILDWLCSVYGFKGFQHDDRDWFLNYNITDKILSISLDLRLPYHKKLFRFLPCIIKGTLQKYTLKPVNLDTIYIDLSRVIEFGYSPVKSVKQIATRKEQETEKGGWKIVGSYYTVADYEVELENGFKVLFTNELLNFNVNDPRTQYFIKNKQEYAQFEEYLKNFNF